MKKILRKTPNWRVHGPDFVQGFWLKNSKSIQEGLRRSLQKCLENGNMPMWMTKGRTILMKNGKEKGKATSNYRPITCLPLVWKLLTGVIANVIYGFLDTNLLLPQELKRLRRKSRGMNDLLFNGKMMKRSNEKIRRFLAESMKSW